MAYSLTDNALALAMKEAVISGIKVAGVMDKSQALGNTGGEYTNLLENGIDVRLDGNPYRMHHKALVIDDQIVATGWYNFRDSAKTRNDENTLVIHSLEIITLYKEDFDRVWGLAKKKKFLVKHGKVVSLMCFVLFYFQSSFSRGERPLDIKTFLLMILLLFVSCSGEQSAVKPTVDATQRWLNAKCPPSEVCAPQSGPESIGRAYLAAVLAGDCNEIASYWNPDLQTEAVEYCQQGTVLSAEIEGRCRLTEYEIEEVLVEDTAGGKSINFSGYFLYVCDDASGDFQTEDLKLFFNKIDGEWRITGIDG